MRSLLMDPPPMPAARLSGTTSGASFRLVRAGLSRQQCRRMLRRGDARAPAGLGEGRGSEGHGERPAPDDYRAGLGASRHVVLLVALVALEPTQVDGVLDAARW